MITDSFQHPIFVETYDELNVHQDPELSKLVPKDESVYFSGIVTKLNDSLVAQERVLIITDKTIYNIRSAKDKPLTKLFGLVTFSSPIRRKIRLDSVHALTITTHLFLERFILHVDGEYDYLYDAQSNLLKIIKVLSQLYWLNHKAFFTLYMKEDFQLTQFCTRQADLKANINKTPTTDGIKLTPDLFDKKLSWLIENRKMLAQHFEDRQSPVIDSFSISSNDLGVNGGVQTATSDIDLKKIHTIKKIEDICLTTSVITQKPAAQQVLSHS